MSQGASPGSFGAEAEVRNENKKHYLNPALLKGEHYTTISKTALKMHHARAGLLHRISDLADTALELYGEGRDMPAYILTRAILESFALLYYLQGKTESAVRTSSFSSIDDEAMQMFLGTGKRDEEVQAVRVRETIDKLNKSIKGIKAMYGGLSDLAHPNWAGCAGYYDKPIGDNPLELQFDRSPSPARTLFRPQEGIEMLCGILGTIVEGNEALLCILREFTEKHEQARPSEQ